MTQIVVEELSMEEAESLVMAFAEERGGRGFTEEEASVILDWAINARLDAILLQIVLKGGMNIDLREGKVVFTCKGEILPTGPLP